jgi:hypothetical protein
MNYFIPCIIKECDDIVLSLDDYPNVIRNINKDIEDFTKKMNSLNMFILATQIIIINKRTELTKKFRIIKNKIEMLRKNMVELLKSIEVFSSETEKQVYENYFEKYENIMDSLSHSNEKFVILQSDYKVWSRNKYNKYLASNKYYRIKDDINEDDYNLAISLYKKKIELTEKIKRIKPILSTLRKNMNYAEYKKIDTKS